MPPPFPLTPLVLACGALEVNPGRFFIAFGAARLFRFGAEAFLARLYGGGVLRILQSDSFQLVVSGFVVLAIGGTVASGVMLWRTSRRPTTPLPPSHRAIGERSNPTQPPSHPAT